MPISTPFLRRLTLLLTCTGAIAAAQAELIKVSPFLPSASAANAPAANTPVEFRGVTTIGNVRQYRIIKTIQPSRTVGAWLKVGERDASLDVTVKGDDKDRETITVEHAGQTLTLPLKVTKVSSSGAAVTAIPPPPTGAPNVLPQVISTVRLNPTAESESKRLEAVAAEVARRRALREQAAQTQGQMQPGAMPAAPTRQDLQDLRQRGRNR
ncbi:hypothetical protein [Opitutus sp. ER46]|uniref:hypothetical protein n=1 Tax=Opitutus sp. ER46 TaxID=2161864 RepID=UPI000D30D1CF|nr:hypothetical protein [Opitutus sp. ER46]PTY01152.1 hypothetical protein DB354_00475 [Opitutus sp. ER46]